MKRGRGTESLGVSRPAQTLISLRTVCRYIQEISSLTPDSIFKEPVHLFRGSLDISRSFNIGMNHAGGKIPWIHLGHSCYLHISKAIKGKVRPHPFLFSGRDISHLCFCSAEILSVETAVLKDFSVLQDNPLPGRSFRPECRPAGNLLAEIQHRLTDIRGDNLLYLKDLFFPYRQTCHRRKSSFRPIGSSCMETFSLRRLQHILFHPCIIHLPVINAGDCHRRF